MLPAACSIRALASRVLALPLPLAHHCSLLTERSGVQERGERERRVLSEARRAWRRSESSIACARLAGGTSTRAQRAQKRYHACAIAQARTHRPHIRCKRDRYARPRNETQTSEEAKQLLVGLPTTEIDYLSQWPQALQIRCSRHCSLLMIEYGYGYTSMHVSQYKFILSIICTKRVMREQRSKQL